MRRGKKSTMERENVFMLPEDFFEKDEVIQIEALC